MIRRPGHVVDSSVLLDVITEDATWVEWSETTLATALAHGPLVVNAVVAAEIAPTFTSIEDLDMRLGDIAIMEEIPLAAAYLAGHAHVSYRRAGGGRTQILADFLIGAHAAVTGRPLITRDPRRIRTHLPGVELVAPL